MVTMSHWTENINQKIEIIKRNQMENLEFKNTVTVMKIHLVDSIAYLRWQKKESANLKLSNLMNK